MEMAGIYFARWKYDFPFHASLIILLVFQTVRNRKSSYLSAECVHQTICINRFKK